MDIVSNLFPLSKELIASDLKSQSDIGLLASNYMKKYNNITKEIIQPLEIKEILTKINEIANIKGKGTKSLRLNGLLELCKKCRNDQELMYLLRIFKVFTKTIIYFYISLEKLEIGLYSSHSI